MGCLVHCPHQQLGGSLTRLETFGNQISGTVPSQLGSLNATEMGAVKIGISLGESRLSGTLPTQLASVTRLGLLQLGHSRISGTLPAQYNALQQLTFLDVSESALSGTLASAVQYDLRLDATEANFNLFKLADLMSFPRTQGSRSARFCSDRDAGPSQEWACVPGHWRLRHHLSTRLPH